MLFLKYLDEFNKNIILSLISFKKEIDNAVNNLRKTKINTNFL